jgi:isoquinoline 1-oxidoreductase alpha subunit
MQIKLLVNGTERTVDADPSMPLLWALRDLLGLRGTKYGCGISACGACTVHMDGKPVKSCVVPLSAAAGANVTTIEGLGGDHPVQRAWIEAQVPQCGYCQSGQVMQAVALLEANPEPTREEIREGMNGVLCRCGTYVRIESAVQRAAALMRDGKGGQS